MKTNFSIKVNKEYFNFAAAHFLVFESGRRESIHGHNYRVSVKGNAELLKDDMVFDFLNIKPLVKKVCDSLDHKFLLAKENPYTKITKRNSNNNSNIEIELNDGSFFSFPEKDVLLLPLANISAERLAMYIAKELDKLLIKEFQFSFSSIEVEVEESRGQSATVEYVTGKI